MKSSLTMSNITVKNETFAIRCEICHKTDLFYPETNKCLRCETTYKANKAINGITVRVIKNGFLYKEFDVTTNAGTFKVVYNGKELGTESIWVNDKIAIRIPSLIWFVPEFDFNINGNIKSKISVRIWPWFAFRKFAFEIDGKLYYSKIGSSKKLMDWLLKLFNRSK